MDTQILNLERPFEYIHCNGEVGLHIATLIAYEAKNVEDSYELETHSHPIVKYWNTPGGVVWDNVELTDCDVLCREDRRELDIDLFFSMVRQEWGIEKDKDYYLKACVLRKRMLDYDIKFADNSVVKQYKKKMLITNYDQTIELLFEEKDGKIICQDNGKSWYPIYCEAETQDEMIDGLSDICYNWENFTDRKVRISFVTDQKPYQKIIDSIEGERMTWDL